MKKSVIVLVSLTVFIGGFLLWYQNRSAKQNTPTIRNVNQQIDTTKKWETKTDDQVSVTVTITPIDISLESKEWKFGIVMNTHSIELDQDLMKSAILVDDQGKEYKPIAWNGPVGGHHREGTLVFNQITPFPKSVQLNIIGIGKVNRSFIWQPK